jgi:hypothetical protein
MAFSIALLVADILMKSWFIERAAKAFLGGSVSTMTKAMGYGVSIIPVNESSMFEIQHYIYIFLIMAMQTAFFAGLVFLLPKLLKNNELSITPEAALSTAAFASIPITAAAFISSLLFTLFSFSSLSVYIMFAVCGAALVASISLFETGIKKYIPHNKQRLTLIAIGYGIQLMAAMIAILSFVPDRIVFALYNWMY